MVWREAQPGCFEQPLGSTEKAFSLFGMLGAEVGREHYSIHNVASVSLNSLEENLDRFRDAWLALRFEYPDLATTVDLQRSMKKYAVLDEAARTRWSEDTFHIIKDDIDVQSLIASFQRNHIPTCHLIIKNPDHATIVIHASHWRLDGFGAFHLMNKFLEVASSKQSARELGSEVKNLTPTYEDLIGHDANVPSHVEKRVADKLAAFFAELPSAGFSLDDIGNGGIPGGTRSVTCTITESASSELVSSCRAHLISVTAAMQSALATLTFRHAPLHASKRKLAISTPADLRRHTPALQQGDRYATGVYMSVLYSSASAEEGFFVRTRRLMDDYNLAHNPLWLHEDVPEIGKQVSQFLASGPPPPPEPPSTTMCSSFGSVDKIVRHEYGDLRLDTIRVGVEMVTPENVLHVWTFRGRLNLSFNYNESYYKRETIETYLTELCQILSEQLEVPMALEAP
ncbi:MAG: hypothetical protein M1828_006183 [Chrysothrix sp. TS-e1954]|nr:MAG: hypothetical protein M1828_006183 [Chrysothrix sp. TS-e1954]